MKTLIQITGVQYACTEADIPAVMAAMERQKPEVLLVTEQTHDFGIIVRALIGTAYRGVVSRFDLEPVLRTMHHSGTSVLVGQVVETDPEGQCYNICISGDDSTLSDATDNTPDIWAEWHWTGAPILDSSLDDSRLDISIKVALAELQRNGSMNRQTLLEHLSLVLQLARWDVSHETQQQLSLLRRLVRQHDDADVRAVSPLLRHCLTSPSFCSWPDGTSAERLSNSSARYADWSDTTPTPMFELSCHNCAEHSPAWEARSEPRSFRTSTSRSYATARRQNACSSSGAPSTKAN